MATDKAYKILAQQQGISNKKAKELIDRGLVFVDDRKVKIARAEINTETKFRIEYPDDIDSMQEKVMAKIKAYQGVDPSQWGAIAEDIFASEVRNLKQTSQSNTNDIGGHGRTTRSAEPSEPPLPATGSRGSSARPSARARISSPKASTMSLCPLDAAAPARKRLLPAPVRPNRPSSR